ncbi:MULTISPECIES: rod-binding protein [Marinovum]|uniref:rod-binding protein n=1 Tax=Marinovum TaxID=367771 RepID=UPI00237A8F09|nr:rod-binding protein [Marinovum sp. PR37]MDD9743202.1 rod-binding protein [Marinovum sp. PR37]
MSLLIQPIGPHVARQPATSEEARQVAHELEVTFLAEMLKSAGFGRQPNSFNGGIGEEQFSSFLVRAQANAMVEAGGLGLSEAFVKTMIEAENG